MKNSTPTRAAARKMEKKKSYPCIKLNTNCETNIFAIKIKIKLKCCQHGSDHRASATIYNWGKDLSSSGYEWVCMQVGISTPPSSTTECIVGGPVSGKTELHRLSLWSARSRVHVATACVVLPKAFSTLHFPFDGDNGLRWWLWGSRFPSRFQLLGGHTASTRR